MDKVLGLVGLAKRARKTSSGESAVKEAVRFGKAQLVLIAVDASVNTTKSLTDSCKYYDVPYYIYGTKDTLGHAIGHEFNAALCINDAGFANSIERYLQANINGGEEL